MEENLIAYKKVFEQLKELTMSEIELIEMISKGIKAKDLNWDDFDYSTQEIIYKFVWLLFVRATKLRPQMVVLIPMYFDLIKAKSRTLQDLQDELLITEKSFGKDKFSMDTLDLNQIILDIKEFRNSIKA